MELNSQRMVAWILKRCTVKILRLKRTTFENEEALLKVMEIDEKSLRSLSKPEAYHSIYLYCLKWVFSLGYHVIGYLSSELLDIDEIRLGISLQSHQEDFLLIPLGE